jgi:hypothetical protein
MTLTEAKALKGYEILTHKTLTNSTGRLNARLNGKPKTWKTRPDAIRIPAKYGLYEYFQIGQGDTDKPIDSTLEEWEIGSN